MMAKELFKVIFFGVALIALAFWVIIRPSPECESIARTKGLESNCELIGFSLVPDDATKDDEDEETTSDDN
jgi:hypothetical protein